MASISVLQRPANVVSLFAIQHGAPAPMSETNRRIAPGQPAQHPTPANLDEIEVDPSLMRGLPQWRGATLKDGRVLIEFVLDVPGGKQERVQIVLHRPVAAELGQDLERLAMTLHIEMA